MAGNNEDKKLLDNKTPKIFRVDDHYGLDSDDDDSVYELLAVATALIQKPNKAPSDRYEDTSEEDFLEATKETMANFRDRIQEEKNRIIAKRQEKLSQFHYHKAVDENEKAP
jgi:hypothetical protein